MKILALDTSTHACSVALLEGKQSEHSMIHRFAMAPRQHTQLILPMIDEVLDEAGYDISQIDVLAFGRGPGAFTGVRVATGVVQAIAYGANIAVAQISSLAALAQGFYQQHNLSHNIVVANDARMGEVYAARYQLEHGFMTLNGTEQVIKPLNYSEFLMKNINNAELNKDRPWQLIGDAWSVYAKDLDPIVQHSLYEVASEKDNNCYPRAEDIAYLAFAEINYNRLVSAEQVSPVYLRNNIAKKSGKKK